MNRVRAVGVVVPAHDEESLLAACLHGLAVAAAAIDLPVRLALVLDACTDRTAEVAASATGPDTTVLTVAHHCVGAARAAGCRALLDAGVDWLASTDADSVVGPGWLAGHLRYAARGYDAVAGTVTVDDWARHPADVRRRFLGHYADRWGHRHVHGANLGVRAAAYRAVGGFPPVAEHEDVALVQALDAAGRRIAWAADVPVRTSARTTGRAPGGLSGFLSALGDAARGEASLGDPVSP